MKKVIAYSLYGNIEKYTIGALRNAEAIPTSYPGWEGWFYIGKTVPESIVNQLTSLGMKVIRMPGDENAESTMWRFFAFADPTVEYAIMRDTDSRLSERETLAVAAWLGSSKNFHIMRDHPNHRDVVMAGMWGARAEKLRNIRELISDWQGEKTYAVDTRFLKEKIYPLAKNDSMIHADFCAYEPQAIPFPTPRDGTHFVGEVFNEHEVPLQYHAEVLKMSGYGFFKKSLARVRNKILHGGKDQLQFPRTGEYVVAHISTSLFPVSAASRLIRAERNAGVDAVALVADPVQNDLGFPWYTNKLSVGGAILFNLGRVFKKIILMSKRIAYLVLKIFGMREKTDHPWNDGFLGQSITKSLRKIHPDIVHLHWIASGFPSLRNLLKIRQPIVWTFHDTWPVTAGHHLDLGCNACKNGSGTCPHFNSKRSIFFSPKFLWNYKKKIYSKLQHLTIITPSQWLGNIAKNNPLFKGRKVFVIPNCVDTKLFKPMDKESARASLNLPPSKKIVLFSSAGGPDLGYKGFDLLVQALWQIKNNKTTDKIMNDIHLVVIGSDGPSEKPKDTNAVALPFPATFLGKIDTEATLPLVYNAADVFVGPSRYDNFPNVFVESISCGLPAVGFDVGGIPEIVKHLERGYIARSFDIKDLAKGIVWVLGDSKRAVELSKNARSFAEKNLSFEVIAKVHLKVYEQILSTATSSSKSS